MSDENMREFENTESETNNEEYIPEEVTQISDDVEIILDEPQNEQQIPVYTVNQKTEKKKNTFAKIIAYALVFGIVAGGVGGFTNVFVSKYANSKIKLNSTQNVLTTTTDPTEIDSPIADIAQQCMPSIVSITNT